MDASAYCESLFEYRRTITHAVSVGELVIGGGAPVRVQSMTTTNTNDTEASVEQCVRIIQAGGQLVRLTTQGRPEAENLKNIWHALRMRGYVAPLVADVHFNPAAAEIAAGLVEKVRINPGNFMGGAKKFDASADNISDEEWMSRIVEKLRPLVDICKKHATAIRIGVNHGSLSDRIMAKYGDTPQGMVASCIEFVEALEQLNFTDIVISIKASNTRIMVQTVRLLAATMRSRGRIYPLHLGVTEAGSDTEGRIKSAAGIGALLIDGLGDTIRVSLTESPEAEVPVAQYLTDYIAAKAGHAKINAVPFGSYSPYEYRKRQSREVLGIGGNKIPIIIADATGRKKAERCGAEWLYTNDSVNDDGMFLSDQPELYTTHPNCYPLLAPQMLAQVTDRPVFLRLTLETFTPAVIDELRRRTNVVIVAQAATQNPTAEIRALILSLDAYGINAPIVPWLRYDQQNIEHFQLSSSADAGILFIDGLADGLMLSNFNAAQETVNRTALEILQATRVRFTKAEFISCPGCGRTLYDIQSTVKLIKSRFGHLSGLKIGIMGCIVNGIGEMADADYGYVGAGVGKISLYRGKSLIKSALPQSEALDELTRIIRDDGLWKEPEEAKTTT